MRASAGCSYWCRLSPAASARVMSRASSFMATTPAATVAALKSQEPLFRLSFAAYLVEAACDITIALIFYVLLSPVSRGLALLAAFFGVISTVTYALLRALLLRPAAPADQRGGVFDDLHARPDRRTDAFVDELVFLRRGPVPRLLGPRLDRSRLADGAKRLSAKLAWRADDCRWTLRPGRSRACWPRIMRARSCSS